MVALKVFVCDGLMRSAASSSSRPSPQVGLSWGLCAPRRNPSCALQVEAPVFLMVMDTSYCLPATMYLGTDCRTNRAPSSGSSAARLPVRDVTSATHATTTIPTRRMIAISCLSVRAVRNLPLAYRPSRLSVKHDDEA